MLKLSLIRIQNERIKDKQKLVYKKIFNNICKTININADQGLTYCIYVVPEFIMDEITYPFIDCIKYLDKKIEKIKKDKQIIDVSFYVPNVYYFKWIL
jgi:hypothetical protein